jgi:2-amino-4-hydroxy-6-hydroxymethyldihydropteridine diphosphokinase
VEGPAVGKSRQSHERTGYLGLGSNVGRRAANLRAAATALADAGVTVTARSALYETAPQGDVLDQPDFLNAVVRVRTALEPLDLLDVCKWVERELGRSEAGPRHAPRPIDVDLLLLGDLELRHERLTLPHPEIATRHFVLAPLLELDPELVIPGGRRAADLLPAVADQSVRLVGPF